ncbi:hypothetical protein G6F56_000911 [Rhizopus delemar]|nr:hypothetical protein G6F56_000911 [Rhizopus delemar]
MTIKIDIECAEQIVDGKKVKQKQCLRQIIDQVQKRRQSIQTYLNTVAIIEKQFERKHEYLQRCIDQLIDREQSLQQELIFLNEQQVDLKKRKGEIEQSLVFVRQEAERHREKKLKCEQRYARVSYVPILATQSKKKYLKARNKDWQTEQQLSDMRGALDLCTENIRTASKKASRSYLEQGTISTQRRASVEKIKSASEQLNYLKEGIEFWSGFDIYQAQVVSEAANYLLKNNRYKASRKLTVDVDQVWIKTFKLACLEYGDCEAYGDKHWDINTLKVDFDCFLCKMSLMGWPRVTDNEELVSHSPVYIFSKDVNTTPEQVSFDTFSMFYSHMMDTSQSAMVVQDNNWLPQSKNLFEKKVDANLVVLLSSVQSPQDILPTKQASFYVNDSDDIDDYSTLAENVVNDIIENEQDATAAVFKLPSICHKKKNADDWCLSKDLSPTRFSQYFSDYEVDLFDETKEADEQFMHEMELIQEFWSDSNIVPNSLVEINSFKALSETYGVESNQYKEAARIVAYLLETVVIPNFQTVYPHKSLATFVFTPVQSKLMKRDEPDVCYKSSKACNNGTSRCQGHGKCVKNNNCFTCQCKPSFVGDSCEYVDAVSDFQLLFWTSVLLIVITTSVVACVYQSGNNMDTGIIMTQSPPKQE